MNPNLVRNKSDYAIFVRLCDYTALLRDNVIVRVHMQAVSLRLNCN